jgi:hypothetical protein
MSDFFTATFMCTVAVITLTSLRKWRRKNGSLHDDELSNPQIQGINRLPAHALLCSFTSENHARRSVSILY